MYQEAVRKRFIEPLNHERTKCTGVELELPIVNLSGKPVSFDTVQRAVKEFTEAFSFQKVKRDETGAIWYALEEKTGDSLSFDCSFNTLEWSFGKTIEIGEIDRRFRLYFNAFQEMMQKENHMLTGMGINPHYKINRKEPVACGRYRMLYEFLKGSYRNDKTFPIHSWPHFGMFAAASQVQMDVDRENVLDVIDVFESLEPYKAVLFANSAWPENPDILLNRDWLWEYSMHGTNPRNVGMWNKRPESLEDLEEYIGSMSMFCCEREGAYLCFDPIPVKEYFSRETVEGRYLTDEGIREMVFHPVQEDIRYLRSYKYVDLTWRGTVEFRSVCTQPLCDTFSVAAFHAGLMERLPELKTLLEEDMVLYHRGMSPKVLRQLLCRRVLPAFVDSVKLSRMLIRILDLARQGLSKRGYKEEDYLFPLYKRAEELSNPAQKVWHALKRGDNMETLIREYARMDHRLPRSIRHTFYYGSGLGLEEESLRIFPDGSIADTPHPCLNDSRIDRDFSEAQVEMITPVRMSPEKLYESVLEKRQKVVAALADRESGKELLWPFSVPPYIRNEREIQVARFSADQNWKSLYREYLAEKYGRRKMLYSGIHLNFSYSDEYLRECFEKSAETDYREFTERRYLELAEKSAAYSWLVVALMAASPVHDASFWDETDIGKNGISGYSSLRTSIHGYWNHFVPVLDYRSLEAYIHSISAYVDSGELRAERELYYPIRLKPAGEFTGEELKNGISHIEYRMIDLNPLSDAGIDRRDLAFLVLLIEWLDNQPALHAGEEQQRAFVTNVMEASREPLEEISLQDLDGRREPLLKMAMRVLRQMQIQLGDQPAIAWQIEKLKNPDARYAVGLKKRYPDRFVHRALQDVEKQTTGILNMIRLASVDGYGI